MCAAVESINAQLVITIILLLVFRQYYFECANRYFNLNVNVTTSLVYFVTAAKRPVVAMVTASM